MELSNLMSCHKLNTHTKPALIAKLHRQGQDQGKWDAHLLSKMYGGAKKLSHQDK